MHLSSWYKDCCIPRIPDPAAAKPDDWDEDAPAKIADPDATKPEGWLDDGPEFVADPDAKAPEDWLVITAHTLTHTYVAAS